MISRIEICGDRREQLVEWPWEECTGSSSISSKLLLPYTCPPSKEVHWNPGDQQHHTIWEGELYVDLRCNNQTPPLTAGKLNPSLSRALRVSQLCLSPSLSLTEESHQPWGSVPFPGRLHIVTGYWGEQTLAPSPVEGISERAFPPPETAIQLDEAFLSNT